VAAAVLLLFLSGSARATAPLPGAVEEGPTDWPLERVWTGEDGLPQASVYALAQASDGYLWLGTDAGAARFDGVAFAPVGATGVEAERLGMVRALLADRGGALWVGTNGGAGLLRAAAAGRLLEPVPALAAVSRPGVTTALQDRAGVRWFGTFWGLLRGDAGTLASVAGPTGLGGVFALLEAPDASLWAGTHEGVAVITAGGGRFLPLPPGDRASTVLALAPDGDGGVWLGTAGRGLLRARFGADGRPAFDQVPVVDGSVGALLRDRRGRLWIGTNTGLLRFADGRLARAPAADVLAHAEVLSLLEDREGNVWVGTRAAGLARLTEGPFRALLPRGSPRTGEVVTVAADGAIWIGTRGGGLYRAAGAGVPKALTGAAAPCVEDVKALLAEGADVWVGGAGGRATNLCRLRAGDGGAFTRQDAVGWPSGAVVQALRRTRDGTLWVGTWAGVYRQIGGAFAREPLDAEAGDPVVHDLLEASDGRLWAATADGLFARAADGGAWRRVGKRHPYYALHEDTDGTLWLGAREDLRRVRDGQVEPLRAPGVLAPGASVWSVRGDAQGFLWLCTAAGVLRVPRAALAPRAQLPAAPALSVQAFGAADGLPGVTCGAETGAGATARGPDGRLWFAGLRLAAGVDPAAVPREVPEQHARIEALTVDGRAYPLEPGAALVVPPSRGDVQVAFTSLHLRDPTRLRFRHRLEPLELDWRHDGAARTTHYTNLPAGRYVFRVAAWQLGAAAPGPEATLSFELLPPLHQRAGVRAAAIGGALALVVAIAWGVNRSRLARQRLRHEAVLAERTRIAADLHDTMAQGLTAIAVQLEAAGRRMRDAPDVSREHVEHARAQARQSLAEARRAVWDLKAGGQTRPGDLPAAIEALGASMSAALPARVQVEGTARSLAPDAHTALVRMAQEILANAVRHAQARRLEIRIIFHAAEVELIFEDDGVGFDPAAARARPGHHGLSGLEARAQALGGALAVKSAPGQGTRIQVRVRA
jgi:signal transduction histidine kinase/ligand-binding sensor domain-containing protein